MRHDMTIRIEQLDSLQSLSSLRRDWNSLAEMTPGVSVFSTWEWQTTWWKHYQAGKTLRVLLARDGVQIVGILPMYLARSKIAPHVTARELRLIGTGGDTSPDYLGPLIEPAQERVVNAAFAEHLSSRRREWDTVRLTDVAPCAFLGTMADTLHLRGVRADVCECSKIQRVRLPRSWAEYVAGMPTERRRRIGKLRRRVEQQLGGRLVAVQTEAQLPALIDDLIALHRKRWDSKGSDIGAFRSPAYIGFHREVITACHRNGWIRLYRIEVAGRTVAIVYCYAYRGEILLFQNGFDPEHEHFRLGQVLIGFSIEQAIAEGASAFDMLKGDHEYKASWSNDVRTTCDLVAYNTSGVGRLALARRTLGQLKRSLGRSRLRAAMAVLGRDRSAEAPR